MTKNPASVLVLKDHRSLESLWKSLPFESAPTYDFHVSRNNGGEIKVQMSINANDVIPKINNGIHAGLYDLSW